MDLPRRLFECPWFAVEAVEHPHGHDDGHPYYRIVQRDGVICVALTTDKKFILVRQYRPAIEKVTTEIPAGYVDDDETAEEAARRELYEETGYVFDDVFLLGSGRLLLNRVASLEYVLLATGGRKDPNFVRQEAIEVVLATPEELRSQILTGKFEQLAAMSILFLADLKLGMKLL